MDSFGFSIYFPLRFKCIGNRPQCLITKSMIIGYKFLISLWNMGRIKDLNLDWADLIVKIAVLFPFCMYKVVARTKIRQSINQANYFCLKVKALYMKVVPM